MSSLETSVVFEIRNGIAESLRSIPGLQASPYALGNATPPAAHVLRGQVLYDQAMQHGAHEWTMRVQAFVALVTDQGAQMLLDRFLSPTGLYSVKAAIEANPTLDGLVSDLQVTTASGEQVFLRDQGGSVLGSEWTVEVLL